MFHVDGLRYVPTSHYKVLWPKIGFDYRLITREYLDAHDRSLPRLLGKLSRALPFLLPLYRLFQARHVYLYKREP